MRHLGIFLPMPACSIPRHVEVSGWMAAMQEFMAVILEGQSKQGKDQSNTLNKTDFPLEVSKVFSGFDFRSIT